MSVGVEDYPGQDIISRDTVETKERTNVEQIEKSSLKECVDYLLSMPAGVVIVDSDYTLRESHKHGIKLRFGEIPAESLELLGELVQNNWEVIIVSNQPKEGHQIARFMARLRGFPFFPDSLEAGLGKEKVLGGSKFFLKPYKKSEQSVNDVFDVLDSLPNEKQVNITNGLYMIGDKESDIEFFSKVAEKVKQTLIKRFLKLPNPPLFARPF